MLRQLDQLTEHINRIGLFRRDVTRPEVELLLACQLPEPLQTTHNKLLALLLESLSAARFITLADDTLVGQHPAVSLVQHKFLPL